MPVLSRRVAHEMSASTDPSAAGMLNSARSGRGGAVVKLMAAVVLGAVAVLGCLGALADAVHPSGGGSRPGDIVLAVILAGLAAVAGRWGMHVEHGLRSHTPAAASWPAVPVGTARRALGFHRYAPRNAALQTAVLAGGGVAFVVLAVSTYSRAQHSAYVQNHGLHGSASVLSAEDVAHASRSGTHYTCQLTVSLVPPVDGVISTVVYYPARCQLGVGDRTPVLIDPHQLSYAELPGSPNTEAWQWIAAVGAGVLFGAEAGLMLWFRLRLARHRSTIRGSS